MIQPFLTLEAISKHYPGVRALSEVSLAVSAGEVLGLVGENGAGKSTLMKILGGVVEPDGGTITIAGTSRDRLTVAGSMAAGIAFVHQELNLFDNLTAAANIFIGREPLRAGVLKLVDSARMARQAAPLLAQLGADFGPDALVADLSLAQRQLVEIAKALSVKARLLILDEPTSSLTVTETDRLLDVVRRLRSEGVAVILITHRLAEVEHVADRVLVLRDGHCVATLPRDEIRADRMIRHMIGRDLAALYRPPARPPGEVVLDLDGLRTAYRPEQAVSLPVRAGEILGLAGLIGSGRSELARAAFGLESRLGGRVTMGGAVLPSGQPDHAVRSGLYLVPEDRKTSGLVLDLDVAQNISLPNLRSVARRGLIDTAAETGLALAQIDRLKIRTAGPDAVVRALSGGNQQKVVLAKWLSMAPKAVIFDEPTRGIDVGSKREIYDLMRGLADAGVAILMISSDMEEVVGVSDRVAVMHEGRIAGTIERQDLTEAAILALAIGRTQERETV